MYGKSWLDLSGMTGLPVARIPHEQPCPGASYPHAKLAKVGHDEQVRPLNRSDGEGVLRSAMMPSTFVMWRCRPEDLPITWAEVRERVAAANGTGCP